MKTFTEIGYLDADAISSLRSVFESTLLERGLKPGCDAAEDLAALIVRLYLAGIADEDELLQRVRTSQAA